MGLEKILTVSAAVALGGCANNIGFTEPDWARPYQEEAYKRNYFTRPNDPKISVFGFGGFQTNIMNGVFRHFSDVSYTQNADLGEYEQMMDDIFARHAHGDDIVLVGHSLGCSNARYVASRLDEVDMPVMLVLLDDYGQALELPLYKTGKITDNVHTVCNVKSKGPFIGPIYSSVDVADSSTYIVNLGFNIDHNSFNTEKYAKRICAQLVELVEMNRKILKEAENSR